MKEFLELCLLSYNENQDYEFDLKALIIHRNLYIKKMKISFS